MRVCSDRLDMPAWISGVEAYADVVEACGVEGGFPRHWNPNYNSLLNADPLEVARRLRAGKETAE